MISPTDLFHPPPAPHFKTFQANAEYCQVLMATFLSGWGCVPVVISTYQMWGRDSSVGTATRDELDGPIESRLGARFCEPVQTSPGAHPASYTMGTGSFLGVKWPGRGIGHAPHLAPRLKKVWSYTSTPPLGLRGLF